MKISNKTACAAALLAFTLPILAQTWNVDANGNWNVDANWTPATFPNAAGAIANLNNDITKTNVITLGAPITVGTLNIGDADGTNVFVLPSGNTLTFESATAGGDTTLNVTTAGISGNQTVANLTLGGTSNLTINALGGQSFAFHPAATLAVGSNTLTINTVLTAGIAQSPYGKQVEIGGAFTGTGALVKNGVGGFEIQGNSTFSGAVTINAGSINVRNVNGTLASTSFTVNAKAGAGTNSSLGGSALAFGDTGVASIGRINDAASITLNGGSVVYNGSNSLGISSETIGSITANEGSSNIYIPRGGTLQSELYMSTLNRTAGATLQVRGTLLGSDNTTAGSTRVFISTAPTLSGDGGASGTTTMSILPWAYGGTNGGGDNSDLVTYDATNGLRGLATAEYAVNLTGGATNNVSVGSLALGGSDRTVNGLKYTNGSNSNLGSNTLNVTSGAVIFSANNGAMDQGTLNFGAAEGVITSIASNTNTITSVITGSGGLTKGGTGTLILAGDNTYTGTTTVAGGTLQPGTSNAFHGTAVVIANTTVNPIGSTTPRATTLNLNGLDQSIASLAGGTFGGNLALGSAELTLDGTTGTTIYGGIISGSGSIIKSGGSTQILTGANTYKGTTNVNSGTLLINGDQSGATGDITVDALATLGGTGIIGGNTTIADTGKLEFNLSTASGSHDTLELAAGKTLTFTLASTLNITSSGGASPGLYTLVTAPGAASIIGAVPASVNLPSGWTATAPVIVADGPNTSLQINITSTGGGVQTGYDAWAGGAAFDVDTNGDGVKNGLAFLLGAANPNVSALGLQPVVTQSGGNLTLTFTMLNSADRGNATLNVEHSSDLGISDPWLAALVPDTAGPSGPVNGVSFNVTLGSPNSVTATISSSEAVSGKLFGRLKAVQTP